MRGDLPVLRGDIAEELVAFSSRKEGAQHSGWEARQFVNHGRYFYNVEMVGARVDRA
jgi:hypothetical protein